MFVNGAHELQVVKSLSLRQTFVDAAILQKRLKDVSERTGFRQLGGHLALELSLARSHSPAARDRPADRAKRRRTASWKGDF